MMKWFRWARIFSYWKASISSSRSSPSLRLLGYRPLSLEWFTPHHEVALDAALRVEDQIPRSRIGGQVLYHVSDHTAEPTEPVAALHGHPSMPAQIVEGTSRSQHLYFLGARVQFKRGKYTAIGNRFKPRLLCGQVTSKQGSRRGCGNIDVGHERIFRNSPGFRRAHPKSNRLLIIVSKVRVSGWARGARNRKESG